MTSEFEDLREWSERMSGALQLLSAMDDSGLFNSSAWRGEQAVYSRAEIDYLKAGKMNVEKYILYWNNSGRYRNHVRDKKGKLIKCEFYIEK